MFSRIILLGIILLIPALFVSKSLYAHVGGKVYFLYELRDDELPDLHDGTLNDWKRLFPMPTLTDADFGSFDDIGEGASIGAPD